MVQKSRVDVVFFHFFKLRGNKNTLQKKVDDKIFDFILSNTIFELFLFRLHYYTMCHEVLENEKMARCPLAQPVLDKSIVPPWRFRA